MRVSVSDRKAGEAACACKEGGGAGGDEALRAARSAGGYMMLFLTFHSQEERREYGGSAFIEMQFCKLPAGTGIKDIVAVGNINDWEKRNS